MTTLKTYTVAVLVVAALLILGAVLDHQPSDTDIDRSVAASVPAAVADARRQMHTDRAEAAIKREIERRRTVAAAHAQDQ